MALNRRRNQQGVSVWEILSTSTPSKELWRVRAPPLFLVLILWLFQPEMELSWYVPVCASDIISLTPLCAYYPYRFVIYSWEDRILKWELGGKIAKEVTWQKLRVSFLTTMTPCLLCSPPFKLWALTLKGLLLF